MSECRCAEVFVGGKPTGSRNWNPDCPVHPWNDDLQAQADRAAAAQRLARHVRQGNPIHKAQSDPYTLAMGLDRGTCVHCLSDIHKVPGGQGPTWVHDDTGTVVGSGPEQEEKQ